jgi:hypothetical protein
MSGRISGRFAIDRIRRTRERPAYKRARPPIAFHEYVQLRYERERRSIPEGFIEARRTRLQPRQRVFQAERGNGTVISRGWDKFFVRVRYDNTNVESEEEAFSLFVEV